MAVVLLKVEYFLAFDWRALVQESSAVLLQLHKNLVGYSAITVVAEVFRQLLALTTGSSEYNSDSKIQGIPLE